MKVERIATRVSELLAAGDNAQIALARGLLIAHKRTGPFCALVAGRLGKVGPVTDGAPDTRGEHPSGNRRPAGSCLNLSAV